MDKLFILTKARRVSLTLIDIILIGSAVILYNVLLWAAKKYFPNVDKSKRETAVFFIVAILLSVVLIISARQRLL